MNLIVRRLGLLFCLCGGLVAFPTANSEDSPDLFLPKVYEPGKVDVRGWLMSEKLDGVRAYWDGQQLLSRGGQIIHAPAWFLKGFPKFELDGELWTRRQDFENIVSIVRQQEPDNRWHQISYRVFDVPNQSGGLLERLAVLETYLKKQSLPQVKLIPQIPVETTAQVQETLDRLVEKGAEGLILRQASQPYVTGRTQTALKVKTYWDDECQVIGYTPGKGRFDGLVGSLVCDWQGQRIKLGSGLSVADRESPPTLNAWVTFKYYGLTQKGNPRFPVFLRVRTDQDLQ
ncbi:DNA ligase [Thiomicrospira sp. S5]|uniref:DNA ligase n=1 Tax=Thiomicrospira sp. S5 TaxID=1803865 RepID=UPI000F8EF0B6|nr:DNA ligase [Thiomicrospira sp. S5]